MTSSQHASHTHFFCTLVYIPSFFFFNFLPAHISYLQSVVSNITPLPNSDITIIYGRLFFFSCLLSVTLCKEPSLVGYTSHYYIKSTFNTVDFAFIFCLRVCSNLRSKFLSPSHIQFVYNPHSNVFYVCVTDYCDKSVNLVLYFSVLIGC